MRQKSLLKASRALRVLLALAVMLNGPAAPAMDADATVPNEARHGQHQGHDAVMDQAMAGDPADQPNPNCCNGSACGCGCAAPQAAVTRHFMTTRDWSAPPSDTVRSNTPRSSGSTSTPFRPPA